MKLRPEDLEKEGYILLDTLEHEELVFFVKKYLYRRGFWPVFYFGFILILLITIVLLIRSKTGPGEFSASKAWGNTALGFALSFMLIPLHEYIHAIAYRICGAREVTYDADFKKMVFMAIAHRFVAGAREFAFIAIAPFAVITLFAFMLIPVAQGYQAYILLGLIFTHAAFCGGDIAMLGYLRFHKDKDIATWDDKVNKVSYFFGKPKEIRR